MGPKVSLQGSEKWAEDRGLLLMRNFCAVPSYHGSTCAFIHLLWTPLGRFRQFSHSAERLKEREQQKSAQFYIRIKTEILQMKS